MYNIMYIVHYIALFNWNIGIFVHYAIRSDGGYSVKFVAQEAAGYGRLLYGLVTPLCARSTHRPIGLFQANNTFRKVVFLSNQQLNSCHLIQTGSATEHNINYQRLKLVSTLTQPGLVPSHLTKSYHTEDYSFLLNKTSFCFTKKKGKICRYLGKEHAVITSSKICIYICSFLLDSGKTRLKSLERLRSLSLSISLIMCKVVRAPEKGMCREIGIYYSMAKSGSG